MHASPWYHNPARSSDTAFELHTHSAVPTSAKLLMKQSQTKPYYFKKSQPKCRVGLAEMVTNSVLGGI